MLAYIIPVVIITLLIIVYGVLNTEDEDSSSSEKNSGCEHCGEKDSCPSKGHDDFVHFTIHKPEMNPADGLFGKKKSGRD